MEKLAKLLNRLVAQRPGSPAARKLVADSSRQLLKIVVAGGRRGAERAIKAVRLGSVRLAAEFSKKDASLWKATVGKDSALLSVWFSAGPSGIQSTYVHYDPPPPPKPVLTPKQRARHETQEEFYKRYMDIGDRYYGTRKPVRLPKADNVILLIGELEGDVNNGGFSQYLDNKGRRRALAALTALRTVGARKTAAMLKAAMAPSATGKLLSALDDRFYRVPEDLAVMTMTWVRR